MTRQVDFDLNLTSGDDAIQGDPRAEVARILINTARRLVANEGDEDEFVLLDLNGNVVGKCSYLEEDDEAA